MPVGVHTILYRGVEQLVARRAHNPEAGGSSPPPATSVPQSHSFAEFLYFQGFLPALVRSAFAGFLIPVTALVSHRRDTLGSLLPDDRCLRGCV